MPNSRISQPAAKTISVVDLVAAAQIGRLRIPQFQRPLRWQWEDVRRLFDSIVKGYPIGNLLLWVRPAPEARVHLGGLDIHARDFQDALWVVDGQQRLTSLANALSEEGTRDERFALAYDLNEQAFKRPRGRDEDGFTVPLPVLFDLQRLIRWFTKDHPEAGEKLEEASRVTRAIREYQVPAYLVEQEDETVLRDIFDRMNNYGKRLSRAEVFSALHPGQDRGVEPASHCQRIAEAIHAGHGFGILDNDTVLHAVLARRGGNVSRDIRLEFSATRTREPRDFQEETPEQAYREGEQALSRSVAFLKETAGVPHFAFLPYRYLLVVLTRFFSHFPQPHPRNRQLLRRWFWRAAMMGPAPFAASWTNAMRMLSTRIVAGDETGSIQRLLEDPIDATLRCPKLGGFRTNTAASRIILTALWDLSPCSPLTGRPYDSEELAGAIGPDGTLKELARPILAHESKRLGALAANRMFVLEEELPAPLDVLLMEPPLARAEREPDFLASHGLNEGLVTILAHGDRSSFLEGRQQQIAQAVRTFLERMAETGREDTPPLDDLDLDEDDEERDDALA